MFSSIKLALAGLTLGAGLFASGCTSNQPQNQSSLEPSAQGVTCTKCETTWVQVPTSNGKRVTGYTWAKKDTCPECMDAVTTFFNTGKLQHSCKTCGDTLEICEMHQTK